MKIVMPDCVTLGNDLAWATLSRCGRYRYALGRRWGAASDPTFAIVMLNPSTADHGKDDPTIRKCVHFAKQEGCGGLLVRNLFGWRTAHPHELRGVADPTGPDNQAALDLDVPLTLQVAAWGALTPGWLRRLATAASCRIARADRPLHVLGLTKDDHPRHPLFVRNASRVVLWSKAISTKLAATR